MTLRHKITLPGWGLALTNLTAITIQPTMIEVSTAPADRTSDVGSLPQGTTFDSPSRELEDESDMISPSMLEPTGRKFSHQYMEGGSRVSAWSLPTFPMTSDACVSAINPV
jgi:hypothetical protein